MGVPAFFRYISERYPCLSEVVKEYQVPDFDNMYLDMNGIIHTCSHPDDSNPHFRITEEKIFQDIFHYISMLYQLIKPRKLFFMAIDGVAPRAKMNQQRGRRFRSAREAEMLEKKAIESGEELPTEKRFDSNCITPGTAFMAQLHEQLRYFIRYKITTDPTWAKCKFILSGHETPGEGEHKIMDYIRYARSQPDHDPNTKHCLYGLDADLIMLGLCTHEPHFTLLREEVKFGRKSTQHRTTAPEETTFFLLHLSLMRDYLEQEFIHLKTVISFEYNLDKIIDDWILMGFLVGNDFIPNLPHMHINTDALPILYRTYMKVLPTLDGYINEAGVLNLSRFQAYMEELAIVEKENFFDIQADLKYFEDKTGRKPNLSERKSYKNVPDNRETFDVDVSEIKTKKPMEFGFNSDLQNLIKKTNNMLRDNPDELDPDQDDEYVDISDEDGDDLLEAEFVSHRQDYYLNKLEYPKVTKEVLRDQAECYVRAIQWNLHYYYHGCVSWSWFYPHHYAPYIADIINFKDFNIKYDLGEPFKPFEQLLAVLPAASKDLLPEAFHSLMTSDSSSIFHYYPTEFETDLNGKRNEWEAVVLIPFIKEESLLLAMEPCYEYLTKEEKKRNTHGPMLIYTFSSKSLGEYPAPQYFPPIKDCQGLETKARREELDVPLEKLKKGPLPNALIDKFFPGFPTLKNLNFKSQLIKSGVKVFDQISRNENMILQIIHNKESEPILEQVAANLLGKVVWVGWPHLTEAKVLSVSNKEIRIHYTGEVDDTEEVEDDRKDILNNVTRELNQGGMLKQWFSERMSAIDHNMMRMGIDLGEVNILVHAVNLKGYRYCPGSSGTLTMGREWCQTSCSYALQAVLPSLNICMPEQSNTRYTSVEDAFKTYDNVFVLAKQYYGCMAMVVDSSHVSRTNRIKISLMDDLESSIEPGSMDQNRLEVSKYLPVHHISSRCGVSSHLVSRITGVLFIHEGQRQSGQPDSKRINIGLNLKNNKKNEEVTGFTKRCNESYSWLYSSKCGEILEEYVFKFPDVFTNLTNILNMENFYESDVFPGEVGQGKLQNIVDWLAKQPHKAAPRRTCGSTALEPDEIVSLTRLIDSHLSQRPVNIAPCTLQVKVNLLFKPQLHYGILPPDPKADFQLYDRIVSVNTNCMVPIGLKGTIVGIEPLKSSMNSVKLSDKMNAEVLYIILFDKPFPGGLPCEGLDGHRIYRLKSNSILNISYGRGTRAAHSQDGRNGGYQQNPSNRFHDSPTVLRPNGGYQSAFANYSPTKEKQGATLITANLSCPPLCLPDSFSVPPPPLPVLQNQPQVTSLKPPPYKIHTAVQNKPYEVKPANDSTSQPMYISSQYSNYTVNQFASTINDTSYSTSADEHTNMLKAMLNIPSPAKKNISHSKVNDVMKKESPLIEQVANFIQDHANSRSTKIYYNSQDRPQWINNSKTKKAPKTNWREEYEPVAIQPRVSNWRCETQDLSNPYPEIAEGLINKDWSSNIKSQVNDSDFSSIKGGNGSVNANSTDNPVCSSSLRKYSNSQELAAAGRSFQKAVAQISKTKDSKADTTKKTDFIPLQAVTNRRKNQRVTKPPKDVHAAHGSITSTLEVTPIAVASNTNPAPQKTESLDAPRKKKKKSRIAASFPEMQ